MSDSHVSAQAASLKAWIAGVREIVTRSGHVIAQYPAPPARLTLEDCAAAGFRTHGRSVPAIRPTSCFRSTFRRASRTRPWLIERRRRWARRGWNGTLLWIDGEPVPVPRNQIGDPLCDRFLEWLDSRFVYAQVGGLPDHPLYDPSKIDPLGDIRGVLVWDALRQRDTSSILNRPRRGRARWRVP